MQKLSCLSSVWSKDWFYFPLRKNDVERFELLWRKSCEELKKPTFCQVVRDMLRFKS